MIDLGKSNLHINFKFIGLSCSTGYYKRGNLIMKRNLVFYVSE